MENANPKRSLGTIGFDAAAGITAGIGSVLAFETAFKYAHEIASSVQPCVGSTGSALIDYGIPGAIGLAEVYLVYKIVKSMDRLGIEEQKSEKQKNENVGDYNYPILVS